MGFNVTGQEVATGVYDPSTMFIVVGIILLIGVISFVIYSIINLLGGK